MTDLRQAAQRALEALAGYRRELADRQPCDAETALRAALAQQAEPVAWYQELGSEVITEHPESWGRSDEPWVPLYTAPPQRQPLTDEKIDALWRAPMSADWEHREFARAIEQAHGIIESEIKEDKR